jgi:hypothetical protein
VLERNTESKTTRGELIKRIRGGKSVRGGKKGR